MSASELPAGLAVGRYVIERRLGAGGMGVVYVARHPELAHSRVAIKVLAARFAADAQLVARFHGEAQAASRIGHPNIISVLDCGQLYDGRPYLVMELLNGEGLDAVLAAAKGPLSFALGARIFDQLCLGLSAAHQAGVVHRDLKPENVFVVRPRHGGAGELYVKILDFGIAKPLAAGATLTGTGEVLGTPHYMSPEQCRGQKIDQRTDIYALGVMLYECFTGQRPFQGASGADLLVKHIIEEPRPPRELGLAVPALERLILDCLAKTPAERPASVADVRARLLAILGAPAVEMGAAERGRPSSGAAAARGLGMDATLAAGASVATDATLAAGTNPTLPPATTTPGDDDVVVERRARAWLAVPVIALGLAALGATWALQTRRMGEQRRLEPSMPITAVAPAVAPPPSAAADAAQPTAVLPVAPAVAKPAPANRRPRPGKAVRAGAAATAPRESSRSEDLGLIPSLGGGDAADPGRERVRGGAGGGVR